jgi:hypothetical protein
MDPFYCESPQDERFDRFTAFIEKNWYNTEECILSENKEEEGKPTFDVYSSEKDGVCVVHVDTEGMPEDGNGPIIRIYLNDGSIYENPEYDVG